MAGHGRAAIQRIAASHGLEPGKALHEALINGLFPAPEQFAGPPCNGPPESDGHGAAIDGPAITKKLQGPGLGVPGLKPG